MSETQQDVKQLKKENEEPKEIKSSEESTEEPMEIKYPKEDENTTDWFDKNRFKKISAINSNKFNHKNKIGKFKDNDHKDLGDNIKKIQLVKYLLQKSKCIKRIKKC